MASLAVQTNVVAMYYAILGQKPSGAFFDIQGQNIQYGLQTTSDFVNSVLTSPDGQALYAGKSDSDILTAVYTKAYGVAPTAAVLSGYLTNGNTVAQNIASLTISLVTYNGFDSTLLSQQQAFQQILNTALYAGDGAATGLGGLQLKGLLISWGLTPLMLSCNPLALGSTGAQRLKLTLQLLYCNFVLA